MIQPCCICLGLPWLSTTHWAGEEEHKQQKRIFSQFWRPQIQGQGTCRLVSGEALLPNYRHCLFTLSSPGLSPWRGGEIAGASSSSYKDPSPIGSSPHPYDLIYLNHLFIWAFQVSQTVKNLPAMPESQVKFPDREDPLEKGIITHSSSLAWRIPWTEEWARVCGVTKSQTQLSD